jgi:predicted metalloprotease with PDZ domain
MLERASTQLAPAQAAAHPLHLTTSAGCALAILPILLITLAAASPAAAAPIALEVDATDVVHGVQHAHLIIPVHPGPLTLAYPKWVPGEHAPNGPITQMVNLHIAAGGAPLSWRRDPLDAFSFIVDVPPGVNSLDVQFDYVSPPKAFGPGFGESPSSTQHLLIVLFAQLVLYPADAGADQIQVKADVRLPPGWKADDALLSQPSDTAAVSLPTASLSTLADSPLLAGEHLRSLPLASGPGAARMSIAADTSSDLAIGDNVIGDLKALIPEAAAVFGEGHYRRYVWLLSLSDTLAHDGTEHHESSDVREAENLFTDPARGIDWRLFPHEYVHSWNGKYRRPVGLATRNFQQPMIDDMLWVYEGLTRYYGDLVLTARSRLATPEQTRAYLAYIAAQMDRDRPGRLWRTLGDTATAVPAYGDAPSAWTAARRGPDYYGEMLLIWLEADMAIRASTDDRKSLDDFCRRFFSGPEREPVVKPYTRADLITALHDVAPLDWEGFFAKAIDTINPHAPLGGLQASGWSLTYDDAPNPFLNDLEKVSAVDDLSLSLGVWVNRGGRVQDVVPGSPAFVAGVAPGLQLISIDGRKWTGEAARAAILSAETTSKLLELTVQAGRETRTLWVDYHRGLRLPHLVRVPSRPDRLSELLSPHAAPRVGFSP